eukprot:SM000010S04265  [mRNA]  locus=s10:668419:670766:+ [translate_table: standard]
MFGKYGRIVRCDFKSRPEQFSFCFIEYEDERDAADAIRNLDGAPIAGARMLVEASKERRRAPQYSFGGKHGREDCRAIVDDLPQGTSWQDLKDFGREGGPVVYSDVFMDNRRLRGVLEFESSEACRRAVRRLDGQRIHGAPVYVREELDTRRSSRYYSRSRSRSPPRYDDRRGLDSYDKYSSRGDYGGRSGGGGGRGDDDLRGGGGYSRRARSPSPLDKDRDGRGMQVDRGRSPGDPDDRDNVSDRDTRDRAQERRSRSRSPVGSPPYPVRDRSPVGDRSLSPPGNRKD